MIFFLLLFSSLSFDHSLFNKLSIYQIMVSSFQDGDPNVGHNQGYGPSEHKGDLQGIINSLDYIKDLGFNAIWMTPIFASYITDTKLASTGYYPNDYFNIDYRFGGNDKFRELVQTAHNKGIYIILDVFLVIMEKIFNNHQMEILLQIPKRMDILMLNIQTRLNFSKKLPDIGLRIMKLMDGVLMLQKNLQEFTRVIMVIIFMIFVKLLKMSVIEGVQKGNNGEF